MLIAGPTASGKSALALELAQKTGGVVINTDSMQVYRDLRIITARPTGEEETRAPHRLYEVQNGGHLDRWRDASFQFTELEYVAPHAQHALDLLVRWVERVRSQAGTLPPVYPYTPDAMA